MCCSASGYYDSIISRAEPRLPPPSHHGQLQYCTHRGFRPWDRGGKVRLDGSLVSLSLSTLWWDPKAKTGFVADVATGASPKLSDRSWSTTSTSIRVNMLRLYALYATLLKIGRDMVFRDVHIILMEQEDNSLSCMKPSYQARAQCQETSNTCSNLIERLLIVTSLSRREEEGESCCMEAQ